MSEERKNFDRVLEIFDKLYQGFERQISPVPWRTHKNMFGYRAERALYLLLLEHKDRMPPLETKDDYVYFHKCFRQCDVMETGNMDMVFYHLLHFSKLFWFACEEVFNEQDSFELFLESRKSKRREDREENRKKRESNEDE